MHHHLKQPQTVVLFAAIAATALAVLTMAGSKPANGREKTYEIAPGDALIEVAHRFGCSLKELMAANGLETPRINAGDTLKIPKCEGVPKPRKRVGTKLNTEVLPKLMQEHGFTPPQKFMGYVQEITFNKTRASIVRERRFSYKNTASVAHGWNPASTVKIFPAIAAMQYIRELGFNSSARITVEGTKGDYADRLRNLIDAALTPSDNMAHNRLVQFVGYDRLNRDFLSKRNGLMSTGISRAYVPGKWKKHGNDPTFRTSPRITITQGARKKVIAPRTGKAKPACFGVCTTLRDLAETMRRLMLQEQLPASQTYRLKRDELIKIRKALRGERDHGEDAIKAFAKVIRGEGVKFYHKGGYSQKWYSDVAYIYIPGTQQSWIVAMAGYPGRSSLDDAARAIGEIIVSGELNKY